VKLVFCVVMVVRKYFALVVFMLVVVSVVSVVLMLPRGGSLGVGPMIVSAGGGSKGCVTIVFEGGDLTLDGKKVAGNLIVSFGGEFHTIPITQLVVSGGVTVCFSEGFEREYERINERYAELGVEAGLSGGEIVERFVRQGVSAFTLPTLSITLWLYDDEGYDYIYTDTFTSVHYFLSKGYIHLDPFFKAFEDPLAIIREGVTVIIPPIKKLSNILVRVDANSALMSLLGELGITNKTFEVVMSSNHGVPVEKSKIDVLTNYGPPNIGQDGYIPNFWGFPEEPPEFWRNRVYTLSTEESLAENATWLGFISTYGTAYLFNKSRFSSPEEVRNYLNTLYGYPFWIQNCLREGIKEMDWVTSLCLPPSSYYPSDTFWNDSLPHNTYLSLFKPFVIKVTSTLQNPPRLLLTLTRGSGRGGYNVHGLTFMGVLIAGQQAYSVSTNVSTIDFAIPSYWIDGVRMAAISVWTKMRYYYDALILTYRVMSYWGDSSYWIAIPVVSIIPYYVEVEEFSSNYWDLSWFDASGRCISGTCFISNITPVIQDWIEVFARENKLYDHSLKLVTHEEIPRYLTIIDYIGGGNASVGGGFASVLWGISMFLLSLIFSSYNPAVSIMFSIIGTFFGIADQTFYGSSVNILLNWHREDPPQSTTYVEVVKVSHSLAGPNVYYSVGKVPLVGMYEVRIHPQPGGPPPCPIDDPDCSLPLNKTS